MTILVQGQKNFSLNQLQDIEQALKNGNLVTKDLHIVEKNGIKWVWIQCIYTLLKALTPLTHLDPWENFRLDAVVKTITKTAKLHQDKFTPQATQTLENINVLLNIKASHSTKYRDIYLKAFPKIQENENKVQTAITNFANDLFANISANQEKGKSFSISPVSIIAALGMCLHLIKPENIAQFIETIGLKGMSEAEVHQAITATLQKTSLPADFKDGSIEMAQCLARKNQIKVGESLTKLVTGMYHADMIVDDNLQEKVNKWVSDKTHNKIPTLLSDNMSDAVLLSAIHLAFNWNQKFKMPQEGWDIEQFTCADGSEHPVSMMKLKGDFNIHEEKGFSMLEMPYVSPEGRKLSQVIFMPDEVDHLEEIDEDLTAENIAQYRKAATLHHNVNLTMPKTKAESNLSLLNLLKEMGLPLDAIDRKVFDGKITDVIHKTFVSNDEKGSEATVNTSVNVDSSKPSLPEDEIDFSIDKAYCYLIMDGDNILFRGRVSDKTPLVVDKKQS